MAQEIVMRDKLQSEKCARFLKALADPRRRYFDNLSGQQAMLCLPYPQGLSDAVFLKHGSSLP
jgi:hypothetical protein